MSVLDDKEKKILNRIYLIILYYICYLIFIVITIDECRNKYLINSSQLSFF